MKLSVIHLSDIHITKDDGAVVEEASMIAQSSFSLFRESDHCVIAVTGDVAFGGGREEYEIAEKLLNNLRDCLRSEKEIAVDFAIVPGNHDVKLLPEDPVRSLVVDSVRSCPERARDEKIVEACVGAQDEFFKFRDRMSTLGDEIFQDSLWGEYELWLGGEEFTFFFGERGLDVNSQ